jgi:hypothetical protein
MTVTIDRRPPAPVRVPLVRLSDLRVASRVTDRVREREGRPGFNSSL